MMSSLPRPIVILSVKCNETNMYHSFSDLLTQLELSNEKQAQFLERNDRFTSDKNSGIQQKKES